jgi:hypothetical protein
LEALQQAKLYINPKKTRLFCKEVDFLGHHILERDIKVDNTKVDKILSWPVPKSATQTCSFLGLIRYIAAFLPKLAEHTAILTTLITKASEKQFPKWT